MDHVMNYDTQNANDKQHVHCAIPNQLEIAIQMPQLITVFDIVLPTTDHSVPFNRSLVYSYWVNFPHYFPYSSIG
jgi:hypothetical protein